MQLLKLICLLKKISNSKQAHSALLIKAGIIIIGDEILSGENSPLRLGNALPIGKVATGMFVHNIELEPGRGGQMVRSAGTAAQVMAHDSQFTTVKLPSGEIRQIRKNCCP